MLDKTYAMLERLLAAIAAVIIIAAVVSGLCFVYQCYESAVNAFVSSLVFIAGSAA